VWWWIFMESREQRIATLAATLKSSGIAKSDSQARMMAEDMIGVEEHVQKSYEVEHTRAYEYLQTTKNLGTPRQTVKPEPVVESKPDSRPISRRMEELYTSRDSRESEESRASVVKQSVKQSPASEPPSEYTNTNFGGKTLNQAFDHDTHNSALEAIKAQISRKEFKSVDDIVPDSVVPQSLLHEDIEIIHDMEDAPVGIPKDIDIIATKPVVSIVEQTISESVQQPVQDVKEELVVQEQKLDAQKLIDMMEEDGKLEEHTREIKEKPKDVKPKEAYEENNIDLGSMFDFNKGTARK
jgi:hypothetical protein